MMLKPLIGFMLVLVLLSASAAVPQILTVQGRLEQAGSLANGSFDMNFYIYNVSSGGTALWSENRAGANQVEVKYGFFAVNLGEISSLNLDFNQQYWLGIKVGSNAEMVPRIKLTSAAYAFTAGNLDVSSNLNIDSGTLFVNIADNRVGIGTTSPASVLHVSALSDTAGTGITVGSAATRWGAIRTASTGAGAMVFDTWTGSTWNSGVMALTTGGNVGIGTTSPQNKLNVVGDINATGLVRGVQLCIGASCQSSWPSGGGASWSELNLAIPWADVNVADAITVSSSGSVAAGAINSGNLAVARLPTGGNWGLSSNLTIDTNVLTVDFTNKRLGIGTIAPAATLDVNGQIQIRGGTPGAGKVLTSDAAGLASWQTSSGGISGVESKTAYTASKYGQYCSTDSQCNVTASVTCSSAYRIIFAAGSSSQSFRCDNTGPYYCFTWLTSCLNNSSCSITTSYGTCGWCGEDRCCTSSYMASLYAICAK